MANPTHIYVVSSAVYTAGSAPNPLVTVIGTVDTNPPGGTPVPVLIQIPLQSILDTQAAGGNTAVKNLVSPLMLAAAMSAAPTYFPTVAPTQLPTGTWTQ